MDSTIYEDPITATLELGSILIFSVDSIRFCSDMQQIESVVDYQPLSKLPNMPSWIAGGFWYQGDFAHVISVRKKFALPDPDNPKSGSFITTHIDNELFAFWVDRIEDATDAAKFNWQKLPTLNTGVFSRAILQDQHIILEVNLEKLKNTDSLNITNFVSTLSFTKAAIKQPIDTETLSGAKRPNSITKPNSPAVNPLDNNVIGINKNKNSTELNHQPLTKNDPEKNPREGKNITKIPPIARSIRRSITRSTTTPEAIIATQAKERPIANVKKLKEATIEYTQKNITLEKEIITRITKTITKSNYTVSAQEPKQNITPDKQHYKQCDENKNQIANIASIMLLLSTMINGLIYFTFGTSPDLKNTHSKAIQTHVGAEKVQKNTTQHQSQK
ncbi:MAG: chemotaxis protein CheW [Gammaproteobacteria bacterium]|nr:chemotaxis protein CheW [Gammaproteobacteria bacterium]